MNKLAALFLVLFSMIYPTTDLGANMNLYNPDARLENFKKKIQFDEIVNKESTSPLVTNLSVDPTQYPQFKGWKLDGKSSKNRGEELMTEWIFQNNKESFLIEIYLSPKGVEPSRKRFLQTADSTTTMEIPFQKGPSGVGTLSAIPLQQPYDYILFIYKNAYVHVRSRGAAVDALEVSRLISSQLEVK